MTTVWIPGLAALGLCASPPALDLPAFEAEIAEALDFFRGKPFHDQPQSGDPSLPPGHYAPSDVALAIRQVFDRFGNSHRVKTDVTFSMIDRSGTVDFHDPETGERIVSSEQLFRLVTLGF